MNINEKDWKIYRKKLPAWQERYMARLNREYIDILSSDENASEKFWKLEERIRIDKKCPGVIVQVARSKMIIQIVEMLEDGVITQDDLKEFSEEVIQSISIYY